MKRTVPFGPGVAPSGAVAIAAGTAQEYSWSGGTTNPIGIQNRSGGDLYIRYTGTASLADFDWAIPDTGDGAILYIPGNHRVSIYAVNLTTLSGAGKNATLVGWP